MQQDPATTDSATAHDARNKGPGSSPERPVVMVVDDDPDILTLVRNLLTKAGFHVETRSEAPDWNDLARTAPVVVFLDISLGTSEGTTVCSAMRSNPYSSHIDRKSVV